MLPKEIVVSRGTAVAVFITWAFSLFVVYHFSSIKEPSHVPSTTSSKQIIKVTGDCPSEFRRMGTSGGETICKERR